MSVRMARLGALCAALALASTSQPAAACSRIPPGQLLRMTPAELDAAARNMLAGASAMVEGTVVRSPTLGGRDPQSNRGALRVDRVIFGQAPATVPLNPSMCGDFGRVGQSGIVLVQADAPPRYWLHPQLVEAIARAAAEQR